MWGFNDSTMGVKVAKLSFLLEILEDKKGLLAWNSSDRKKIQETIDIGDANTCLELIYMVYDHDLDKIKNKFMILDTSEDDYDMEFINRLADYVHNSTNINYYCKWKERIVDQIEKDYKEVVLGEE